MQERVWREGTLPHCWWECKLVQPLWRTVWKLLKKLKIELPHGTAIPPLGMYPKKNMIWKDTRTPMFITALFTIAKTWKQPKCPSTEEWIKKMWYIYTMEYDSAIKKNKIIPFAALWMDLESVKLSEVNQRRINMTWHPLYMECKKKQYKWTYLQNRNRLTDLENKLMASGERILRELGMYICCCCCC